MLLWHWSSLALLAARCIQSQLVAPAIRVSYSPVVQRRYLGTQGDRLTCSRLPQGHCIPGPALGYRQGCIHALHRRISAIGFLVAVSLLSFVCLFHEQSIPVSPTSNPRTIIWYDTISLVIRINRPQGTCMYDAPSEPSDNDNVIRKPRL